MSERAQNITDKMDKKSDNLDTERQILKLRRSGRKAILEKGNLLKDVQKWGVYIEGEIDETDCEISHLNQY